MSGATEREVAAQIWKDYLQQAWAAPNICYYPYESDVLALRETDMVTEYEIKLTYSDFKADFKKTADLPLVGMSMDRIDAATPRTRTAKRIQELYKNGQPPMIPADKRSIPKHDFVTNRLGPNRFYYVVPHDIVDDDEIPYYAGLIRFVPSESFYSDTGARCIHLHRKKQAPLIHKHKADDHMKHAMMRSTYYRYWSNFAHSDVLTDEVLNKTKEEKQ